MPRFFFHIVNHRRAIDRTGIVLPDLIAAKREAIIRTGIALQDDPGLLGMDSALQLQIHDDAGHCLAVVAIQMLDIAEPD